MLDKLIIIIVVTVVIIIQKLLYGDTLLHKCATHIDF